MRLDQIFCSFVFFPPTGHHLPENKRRNRDEEDQPGRVLGASQGRDLIVARLCSWGRSDEGLFKTEAWLSMTRASSLFLIFLALIQIWPRNSVILKCMSAGLGLRATFWRNKTIINSWFWRLSVQNVQMWLGERKKKNAQISGLYFWSALIIRYLKKKVIFSFEVKSDSWLVLNSDMFTCVQYLCTFWDGNFASSSLPTDPWQILTTHFVLENFNYLEVSHSCSFSL